MNDPRFEEFWQALDDIAGSSSAEPLYDLATSESRLRRQNLGRYLELMAARRPSVLLVGEAPGYRGTAVTGVPFMSMREISAAPGLVSRNRQDDGYKLPTEPLFLNEATSRAMWSALAEYDEIPLLWAAFPHHPHEPNDPLTNRRPTPSEIRAGLRVTLALIAAFDIVQVVAVGRVAQSALRHHFPDIPYVRHPARGGSEQFSAQLRALQSDSRSPMRRYRASARRNSDT